MNKNIFRILLVVVMLVLAYSAHAKDTDTPCIASEVEVLEEWEYLIDENLTQWELWMGVPHVTTELPGATSNDGKNGTPLGLANDPLQVFSVINEGGELQLKITGEVYGGLTTLKEYADYHFSVQFKWGEEKFEPRLTAKRDSGILYHCQGDHGRFWNVWKSSLEFQVQEGDCGDFIGLSGVDANIQSSDGVFDPGQSVVSSSFIKKSGDYEFSNGAWNTLEVFTIGDKSMHFVNGNLVNALEDARYNGTVLKDGQIQIQSEGAELYYRDMKIKAITDFPEVEKSLLGWDGSTPIEEAPIGETIWLRKSGGDQRYVSATAMADDYSLLAGSLVQEQWGLFTVEAHPDGGIGLKAAAIDKYVQVQGNDTTKPLLVAGEAMGTWEQFEWKSKGTGKVALKSVFTGTWVQANWTIDKVLLYPKGAADGTWETFEYSSVDTSLGIEDASMAGQKPIDFYPNPAHSTLTLAQVAAHVDVQIMDLSGRAIAVAQWHAAGLKRIFDVRDLPAGMYVISISGRVNKVFVKR